ncbi:MAG TPA: DNA methyltransferase, partial [Pirellulales bacterium]|nr:DNA methyltransferase [Pirellulales bacterium]
MTVVLRNGAKPSVRILKPGRDGGAGLPDYALWQGDVEEFLDTLPLEPLFDLVVTSPPYNIGKPYEKRSELEEYLLWQAKVVDMIVPRLKPTGSLCWQVGNYVDDGEILPLD